jgi:hypothetical protein
METYLFIALIFIYLITAAFLPQNIKRRIWTLSYILSFIITIISIAYIKIYANETLMRAGELNWYYILYVFGSISFILGLINLWIYKKGLKEIFTSDRQDDENASDKNY